MVCSAISSPHPASTARAVPRVCVLPCAVSQSKSTEACRANAFKNSNGDCECLFGATCVSSKCSLDASSSVPIYRYRMPCADCTCTLPCSSANPIISSHSAQRRPRRRRRRPQPKPQRRPQQSPRQVEHTYIRPFIADTLQTRARSS
jgi:hypothetical protein